MNAGMTFIELIAAIVIGGTLVTIADRKTGLLARLERWLER